MQLKTIRDELHMTLEDRVAPRLHPGFLEGVPVAHVEVHAVFVRPPQSELKFIFGGKSRKFRTETQKTPNFGRMREDVDELLDHMVEIPHTLFAVLGFFTEYKVMNKEVIQRYLSEKAAEK